MELRCHTLVTVVTAGAMAVAVLMTTHLKCAALSLAHVHFQCWGCESGQRERCLHAEHMALAEKMAMKAVFQKMNSQAKHTVPYADIDQGHDTIAAAAAAVDGYNCSYS